MYTQIFDEVVDIIHNDYAGCQDKQGWDHPNHYRQSIAQAEHKGELTDDLFIYLVKDYLLDLKDSHVSFGSIDTTAKGDVGFTVRRYKDKLYVTSSAQEPRLQTGEVILSLDGYKILDLANRYQRTLMETPAEREKWRDLLPHFHTAEIADENGETRSVKLNTYQKQIPDSEYTLNDIDDDTLILTITDFLNADAISELVQNNEDKLTQSKYLIIDVRMNRGGYDTAYSSLLPFLFESETVDLSDEEETMLTNCTERNVDLRIQTLKDMLSGIEDQETKELANVFIQEMQKYRGYGFRELDLSEFVENTAFNTKPGPDKVVVLSDVYCGSSGDSFVELLKESSKVTVAGRATLGMNDYANVAYKTFDNRFVLKYSTSRLSAIDQGKGMTGVGITPHVYIPWTPEHLERDVDLEEALKLLKDD